MIPGINEPLPFWDALVNKAGQITDTWTKYFEEVLVPQVQSASMVVDRYSNGATPLADAVPITILTPALPAPGVYLFLGGIQVVDAAAVASSVSLTLSWTSNGVAQQETFGPIVDGTSTDHLGIAFGFLADGGSPVTIATTYVSNPVNDLAYNLTVSLNINGLPGETA